MARRAAIVPVVPAPTTVGRPSVRRPRWRAKKTVVRKGRNHPCSEPAEARIVCSKASPRRYRTCGCSGFWSTAPTPVLVKPPLYSLDCCPESLRDLRYLHPAGEKLLGILDLLSMSNSCGTPSGHGAAFLTVALSIRIRTTARPVEISTRGTQRESGLLADRKR